MFNRLNTVYLAWQSKGDNPGWFPVGKLEVSETKNQRYTFSYTKGALIAQEKAGFSALDGFPEFGETYVSNTLFPVFFNRVMSQHRSSFTDYLESLNLPAEFREPIHILAVSGGQRRTDSLEVFPKIEPGSEGHFELSFFLHGIRHCDGAVNRIETLKSGDRVQFQREPTNIGTGLPALRVETLQGEPIGYTPNYMVSDFQYIRENCLYPEEINVSRVNLDNPLDSRILLQVSGCWPDSYEGMMPEVFEEFPSQSLVS